MKSLSRQVVLVRNVKELLINALVRGPLGRCGGRDGALQKLYLDRYFLVGNGEELQTSTLWLQKGHVG